MLENETVPVKKTFWGRVKGWLPVPLTRRELYIDTASTVRSYASAFIIANWALFKAGIGKVFTVVGLAAKAGWTVLTSGA